MTDTDDTTTQQVANRYNIDEKWSYVTNGERTFVLDDRGFTVFEVAAPSILPDTSVCIGERIVSCVNALTGVRTEYLRDLAMVGRTVSDDVKDRSALISELLSAVNAISRITRDSHPVAYQIAISALERVNAPGSCVQIQPAFNKELM
jgi:hypothetical protein